MQEINSPRAPVTSLTASQAIKTRNGIYVSGQLPLDRLTGTIITKPFAKAVKQVFKNIEFILQEGGSSLREICILRIYLKDLKNTSGLEEVINELFPELKPAWSLMAVKALPRESTIMIEAQV